jgi:DNA-binding MarR family transcriptional regulator
MLTKELLAETQEFSETFLELVLRMREVLYENDKRYASYGLSNEEFHTLFFLFTSAEPLGPSDIADKINVTRASMTGLLDRLEKENLLERVNHPKDRRKIILKLTENGTKLVEKIMPPHFEWLCKVKEVFSEEDRQLFTSYLLKMRNIMAEVNLINDRASI